MKQWVQRVRYENRRWPLWRWDQNFRYVAKSLIQIRKHRTPEEKNDFEKNQSYLKILVDRFAEKPPASLSMAAVGDLMWIRSGWSSFISPDLLADLSSPHIIFGNLETPIVPEEAVPKYTYETMRYNSERAYLDPWASLSGAKIFSLCNNHALDRGIKGLRRTRETLAEIPHFFPVGGAEAGDEMLLSEIKGFKIGCLGLTFGINTLDEKNAPSGIPVIAFGNEQQEPDWDFLQEKIKTLKARSDLVVLMAHWGFEYEYFPDPLVRKHAHRLIELGVDLILGTSPHVLQPVEVVSVNVFDPLCPVQLKRQGEPPSQGVIAYSLGNFSSIMPTLACKSGAILQLGYEKKGSSGLVLSQLKLKGSVTGRGLGEKWIDGRTVSLSEYAKTGKKSEPFFSHLRTLFGPLAPPFESQPGETKWN